MKAILRTIFIALLAVYAGQACLVTEIIGLEPLGSINGEDARDRITGVAQTNFFLGVYSYCSQFDPIDVCLDESLTGAITGGVAAGIAATGMIEGLEDSRTYTVSSVSDCLRNAGYGINLIAFSILDGKKQCDFVGCSPAPAAAVTNAGITSGLIAGSLCELQETGNILSIGNFNLGLPLPEPLD